MRLEKSMSEKDAPGGIARGLEGTPLKRERACGGVKRFFLRGNPRGWCLVEVRMAVVAVVAVVVVAGAVG